MAARRPWVARCWNAPLVAIGSMSIIPAATATVRPARPAPRRTGPVNESPNGCRYLYAHRVFTRPHALKPLAAVHDLWVYDTLRPTVAETLHEFAAHPRWLGAEPAFMLVLHTWAQDWHHHRHGPVLITGGGLDQDENGVEPKRTFYLMCNSP